MIKKDASAIDKLKQYFDIYIFRLNKPINEKKSKNKESWRDFVIPTKKKKENISENIDVILYNT